MYFGRAPMGSGGTGVVERFDTQAGFTSGGAWSTFDTSTVSASAGRFSGGVFDGRYVYFIPAVNSLVVRFDANPPAPVSLPQWHGSFF